MKITVNLSALLSFPGHLSGDASELGLAPGQWPTCLTVNYGERSVDYWISNGTGAESVTYSHIGEPDLIVWNT